MSGTRRAPNANNHSGTAVTMPLSASSPSTCHEPARASAPASCVSAQPKYSAPSGKISSVSAANPVSADAATVLRNKP